MTTCPNCGFDTFDDTPNAEGVRACHLCLYDERQADPATQADYEAWRSRQRTVDDELELDIGPCCACGNKITGTNNIICLDFQSPTGDWGWSCFGCGLPPAGATAVICDDCLQANTDVRWLITGRPTDKQRVPMDQVEQIPFKHNLSKHWELWPATNPVAELYFFDDSPDAGHSDCLCSWCGQLIPIQDAPPLRFFEDEDEGKTGREARFHPDCWNKAFLMLEMLINDEEE